jgi:hypothetical protein
MKKTISDNCDPVSHELEHRILLGLSMEWDRAIWGLPKADRQKMRKPLLILSDMKSRHGYWSAARNEIGLSRDLVFNHPWDAVREVLRHEMAHQYVDQVIGEKSETAHGPRFRTACQVLQVNSRACGELNTLHDLVQSQSLSEADRILIRVKKLMALAQSPNRHEAEAAMLKAHELIARYNIDLFSKTASREFISVFVGKPALRHTRDQYCLGSLLVDFYFVQGLWITAWVLDRGKDGRVLEISGTAPNVKIASYVHDYVTHYIQTQWSEYNRHRNLTRHRRTDFAVGTIEGFRAKLDARRHPSACHAGSQAMVKARDLQLAGYMADRYPSVQRMPGRLLRVDRRVMDAGIDAGSRLVIAEGITEKKQSTRRLPGK